MCAKVRATGLEAHVARRVREHRVALGMSQEELARACCVSRQTIGNWETARTLPDIHSLAVIAQLAGTTVDELIGDEAPAVVDRSRTARRDLLAVQVAMGVLLAVSACLIIFRFFAQQMREVSGVAYLVYDLLDDTYLYCWGAWFIVLVVRWRLCVRNGLETGYDVADFIKGAAKVPGSWQDRLLGFQARWTSTFWLSIMLVASVLAIVVSLAVLGDAFPPPPDPNIGTVLQDRAAAAHPQWFLEQVDPFGYLLLVLGIEVVAVAIAYCCDRRRNKRVPRA